MKSQQKLRIADNLSFPLDFVTQTQAILAMKRVGKTYTASVQAEEMLKIGAQVAAIDITGAWWGLRSNAAGNGPGYPITIFGGDHGDLPLEKHAGEMLADALVADRFNAIFDLSLLRKSEALIFLVAFLETLYRKNRRAMHLFCDEADFYAPQKPYGEEIKTLGAMNDIILRGGIKGIGCSLITQRPSRINKDVLTQCGILTCLRMSHPRDLEPIEEWVSEHAIAELPAEMRKSLPSMPKGRAWVWAAGWPTEAGIFQQVQIRQRETYDSGATPKAGHAVLKPKVMAPVDLAKLGERIAATVQRAKENNPDELRKRIRDLEKQISAAPVPAPVSSGKMPKHDPERERRIAERAATAAKAPLLKRLREFQARAKTVKTKLDAFSFDYIIGALNDIAVAELPADEAIAPLPAAPAPAKTATPRPVLTPQSSETTNLPPGERAVLIAAVQFNGVQKKVLVTLTGYATRSRDAYVQRLTTKGYVTLEGQIVKPTQAGVDALGSEYTALPEGDALWKYWQSNLPEGELKLLRELMTAGKGVQVEKKTLIESTGYAQRSVDAYLQRLKAKRLVEVSRGSAQADSNLFD